MQDLNSLEHSVRPWGQYQVLYQDTYCKVKLITVKPGGRLSLQYHTKRKEYWNILRGVATVTLQEKTFNLAKDQHINIEPNSVHRVANFQENDLVFLEVQTGEYFGEDDIIRIEDDYNRE